MRRLRKPKLFDFDSDNSINLYDIFQAAYKEMTQIGLLSPIEIDKLRHTKHLSDLLFIPATEMAAFVVIINQYELKNMVFESEVVGFLRNVLNLKPNEARNAMRELKKMGLIVNFKENSEIYYLPARNVTDAIDGNSISFFRALVPKGIERLMDYWISSILDSMHVTTDEIESAVEDIIQHNSDLSLIKYIKPLSKFNTFHEQATVLSICCSVLFEGRPFNLETWERRSCFSRFQLASLKEEINNSTWKPIADGYVRAAGGGYIQDSVSLELTENGYNFFFMEMDNQMLKVMKSKKRHTSLPISTYKTLKPIDLFFNEGFEQELETVELLLSQKIFKRYQREISKNSRMTGITMLFHGDPGTGKTELVFNLAKKTKRDVVKIQVTDVVSKWVGQSEKNLMRIFNDYRLLLENSSNPPILFLNECDQLLHKRVNIRGSVDAMTNALQNILLEQMETFPGILIGTTNLVDQMDTAFHRRWTHKIKFEKPNRETQRDIWNFHIPNLSESDTYALVQQFDFSPAEINNVVKRFKLNNLLFHRDYEIKTLIKMCKNESFTTQSSKLIGFEI